ncbi:MAG: Tex family protein [bacterium]
MEARIAQETGLTKQQVESTLKLLDDGNTVPFIARYRKEATHGLDEVQIRLVESVAARVRALEQRRATILESIESQGQLTPQLRADIEAATDLTTLEDLYAPHKPKRQTRATRAIDAGLEPLARALLRDEDVWSLAKTLVCEGFDTPEAAVDGAKDILAEELANNSEARQMVRERLRKQGALVSKKRRGADPDPNFETYYEFSAFVSRIKPHQVLALRRGEATKALSASVEVNDERVIGELENRFLNLRRNRALGSAAITDGYGRLLKPAVERDVRAELDATADAHAIDVFALNLNNLLMQAPLAQTRVLAIDPGYRTGCKIAVLDEVGSVVTTDMIYVHDNRAAEAPKRIRALMDRHKIDVIAIGNGTGSNETQNAAVQAIEGTNVRYAVVDEAGASVYSASDVARLELPDMDVSYRGAVSIGRRLQDPLAELVKIDPKSIGVGMYQHDVDQNRLQDAVEAVVVDAVNRVGVELTTASPSLLTYVSGIGPAIAGRIFDYQREHGFKSRNDLKKVKGIGDRGFQQCAGFLRLRDASDPLDATAIHPENYVGARAILAATGVKLGDPTLAEKLAELKRSGELATIAQKHDIGAFTLADIVDALVRPGRDPRGDVPAPELRAKQLSFEDLHEGMRLTGTVRNVVDFGAFVDLGVKEDGLVHISQLAHGFVKNPHDVVAVGDRVEVTVVSVDRKRGRIGLSMIQ